jgi:hypothetical protein
VPHTESCRVQLPRPKKLRVPARVCAKRRSSSRPRFGSFVTTPWGFIGKRETQIILKMDERSIHLELGRERTFNRQIKRLG